MDDFDDLYSKSEPHSSIIFNSSSANVIKTEQDSSVENQMHLLQHIQNDLEIQQKNDGEEEQQQIEEQEESASESDSDLEVTLTAKPNNNNLTTLNPSALQQTQQKGIDINKIGEINGQSILDLPHSQETPWTKPGADLTDYFNYGFNQQTWEHYKDKQRMIRDAPKMNMTNNNSNNTNNVNMQLNGMPMPMNMQGMNAAQMQGMNQMMMQRMMANPAMQNMFNNQRCGMLASSNNNRQVPMTGIPQMPNFFQQPITQAYDLKKNTNVEQDVKSDHYSESTHSREKKKKRKSRDDSSRKRSRSRDEKKRDSHKSKRESRDAEDKESSKDRNDAKEKYRKRERH